MIKVHNFECQSGRQKVMSGSHPPAKSYQASYIKDVADLFTFWANAIGEPEAA